MNAQRTNAINAKPLPVAERKARVEEWAKNATGTAKEGARLIDPRDLKPDEKAFGESLGQQAKDILERARAGKAA